MQGESSLAWLIKKLGGGEAWSAVASAPVFPGPLSLVGSLAWS